MNAVLDLLLLFSHLLSRALQYLAIFGPLHFLLPTKVWTD